MPCAGGLRPAVRHLDELLLREAQVRIAVAALVAGRLVAEDRPPVVGEERAGADEVPDPTTGRVPAGAVAVDVEVELLLPASRKPCRLQRQLEIVAAALLDPGHLAPAERELADAVEVAAELSEPEAADAPSRGRPHEDLAAAVLPARHHRRA